MKAIANASAAGEQAWCFVLRSARPFRQFAAVAPAAPDSGPAPARATAGDRRSNASFPLIAATAMQAALDLPSAEHTHDALSLAVQGWVYAGERHRDVAAIEVWSGDQPLGTTELLYARADVAAAVGADPATRTGFSLLLSAPPLTGAREAELLVQVRWQDGQREPILRRTVRLSGRDYRQGDWGILVQPDFTGVVRREHMYNSGPSLAEGNPETVALLRRYLPPPPASILDVGCGLGYYGRQLRGAGYDWLGVEIKPEDCAALAAAGLPHQQVDGRTLPFAAGAFAAGLCIEVLEHVENPWEFIAEVRRVLRHRLIISVPNAEVVTYWREHLAVPWHLLEADHKSFFSRASLRELLRPHFRSIEILSYGAAPLASREGATLGYHLLAVATV